MTTSVDLDEDRLGDHLGPGRRRLQVVEPHVDPDRRRPRGGSPARARQLASSHRAMALASRARGPSPTGGRSPYPPRRRRAPRLAIRSRHPRHPRAMAIAEHAADTPTTPIVTDLRACAPSTSTSGMQAAPAKLTSWCASTPRYSPARPPVLVEGSVDRRRLLRRVLLGAQSVQVESARRGRHPGERLQQRQTGHPPRTPGRPVPRGVDPGLVPARTAGWSRRPTCSTARPTSWSPSACSCSCTSSARTCSHNGATPWR